MFLSKEQPLYKALLAQASAEGLELYDAELVGNEQLRVIVSKAVRNDEETADTVEESAVSSDDTYRLCRGLRTLLELQGMEMGVSADIGIEVSSPGINRTLRTEEHFKAAEGERVKVVSDAAYIGELLEVGAETVVVKLEDSSEQISVPLKEIKRARVEYCWDC